jgi:uracil-DNA glycosylase
MAVRTAYPGADQWVPDDPDLAALTRAVHECRGCDLYQDATQAVFGEGNPDAQVVLVGEQPGDAEDRKGRPFVGPAGRLLDRALEDAGIDRQTAYITNAVKHFRFEREGKRRIHQKPDVGHIAACAPWLRAELALLDPDVVVVLGATAGRALLGAAYRVMKQRGETVALADGTPAVGTVHPSSVLRSRDRDSDYRLFVDDLRVAAELLS